MHVVLKAFPCSFDGITSEELVPGDTKDFGSMSEGLKRAGLIGEMPAEPIAAPATSGIPVEADEAGPSGDQPVLAAAEPAETEVPVPADADDAAQSVGLSPEPTAAAAETGASVEPGGTARRGKRKG